MARETRFTEPEIAVLAAWYREGVTLEQLSHDIGRDRRVIRRTLVEAGVPVRTRRPFPPGQREWVAEQYQAGATLRTLAEQTGYSVGAIRRALLRAGVTPRPPGAHPRRQAGSTPSQRKTTTHAT